MAVYYIADGFQSDAELLLEEFTRKESSEFKIFANIWQKKNFTFIFMGRESPKELGEFTNEIFSISTNFLESECFWEQIGGVYLLYALYINQILNPPVRIRADMRTIEKMKHLREKAVADKSYSLHYVLNYLFKNSFEFVATTLLFGPCVKIFDKTRRELEKKLLLTDFKFNLKEILEIGALESLGESFQQYEELMKNPSSSYTKDRCKKLFCIMKKLATDQTAIESSLNDVHSAKRFGSLSRHASNEDEYPFIDSDVDPIFNDNNPSENDEIDENNRIGQEKLLACNEKLKKTTKLVRAKPIKSKKSRRRGEITRRIRKYYGESPTKSTVFTEVMPVSNIDVLLQSSSEDELLAS